MLESGGQLLNVLFIKTSNNTFILITLAQLTQRISWPRVYCIKANFNFLCDFQASYFFTAFSCKEVVAILHGPYWEILVTMIIYEWIASTYAPSMYCNIFLMCLLLVLFLSCTLFFSLRIVSWYIYCIKLSGYKLMPQN